MLTVALCKTPSNFFLAPNTGDATLVVEIIVNMVWQLLDLTRVSK